MSDDLLPPNRTRLESALSLAMAPRVSPDVIATLWDPQRCPVELLPWLAWALSVEDWNDEWSEATKRQVIADSVDVHRHRGTPYAIRRALQPFGLDATIPEWFDYGGQPYHFKIDANLAEGRSFPESAWADIARAIETNKNVRSWLDGIVVRSRVRGSQTRGGAPLIQSSTRCYPAQPVTAASGAKYAGGAVRLVSRLTLPAAPLE